VIGRSHTFGALVVAGILVAGAAVAVAAEHQPGEPSPPPVDADAGTGNPEPAPEPPADESPDGGADSAEAGADDPGTTGAAPDGGTPETEPPLPDEPTAPDRASTGDDAADDEAPLDPDAETPEEASARQYHEEQEPRPPLPPGVELGEPPEWERRIEVGGDFAVVVRPFANGLEPSKITYLPAPAWGVHLHWALFRWLRIHPYFLDVHHDIDIPAGALSQGGKEPIHFGAALSDVVVETFVFGAKLAPTLEFTDRLRAWVSAGVGWGRFNFSAMTVEEDPNLENSGGTYEVRERSGVFVEFPFGVGVSFDVIERWLAVAYEFSAAPVVGQSGNAHELFQAVDAAGETRDVGAFGAIEASFVNALGLSLIL